MNPFAAFLETDQVAYSLGHEKYWSNEWTGPILGRRIMKDLENMVLPMNDELSFAIDDRFGTDTRVWTDIPALTTMKLLVAQASTRFVAGAPLCTLTPRVTFLVHKLKICRSE